MEEEFSTAWPSTLHGEDENGHLIHVERLVEMDIDFLLSHFKPDDITQQRCKVMERIELEYEPYFYKKNRTFLKTHVEKCESLNACLLNGTSIFTYWTWKDLVWNIARQRVYPS